MSGYLLPDICPYLLKPVEKSPVPYLLTEVSSLARFTTAAQSPTKSRTQPATLKIGVIASP